MSKRKLIFLLFLTTWLNLKSQDLPKIIHPSPEVSALLRFLDHPVSYSTGVPQISIPLYEVKSGSLSVPVSISFHAGGRKASDVPGAIGLGWSLNAGGVISRIIYGKPDEFVGVSNSILPRANNLLKDNYDYIESLYFQNQGGASYGNSPQQQHFSQADYEYDIYSYTFGSNSGKFIYKRNQDSVYLIPLKPFKVNFGEIVDDKGNTYKFNEAETYINDPSYGPLVTSKLLTSIISADKKDTITFSYESLVQTRTTQNQSYTVFDDYSSIGVFNRLFNPNTNRNDVSLFIEPYSVRRLKEIKFKNGVVLFNSDPSKAINEIQIKDLGGTILKSIKLDRTGGSNDYKLSQLLFKDNQGQVIEQYKFDYYQALGSGEDYYGFVNSMSAGVPFHNISFSRFNAGGSLQVGTVANRNPSLAAMNGMIKKITYPTGGSTEYSYELNTAAIGSSGSSMPCGGLRVSKIKNIDNNGNVFYKSYKYGINQVGLNECSYGTKLLVIPDNTLNGSYEMMSYETHLFPSIHAIIPPRNLDGGENYRKRVYTGSFLPDVVEAGTEPVFYSFVTEYDGISEHDNNGKTVYVYEGTMNNANSNYAVAPYPGPVYTPYVSISFDPFAYVFGAVSTDPNLRRHHIFRYDLWKSKPLKNVKVFKRVLSGSSSGYQVVKETDNAYVYTTTNVIKGIHINKYCEVGIAGSYNWNRFAAVNCELPVFLWDNYEITIGREELTTQIETTFTEGGPVTSVTEFKYNNNYLVSETKRILSNSETITSKFKYPFDLTSQPVFSLMTNANMLNYEIEKSEYKNSSTDALSTVRTNYANWGNSILAPQSVESKTIPNNAMEPRILYHRYDDMGHVLSVSKAAGPKIAYVYGYKGVYPIAKIENAEYSVVESILGGESAIRAFRNVANPTDASVYSFLEPLRVSQLLKDAYITTFTYRPLVGLTSISDPNRQRTLYTYDGYQRLSNVRDNSGDISKSFTYNYINPKYENEVKSAWFTKNDCGSNFSASEVQYIVPAGMYTSNMSQADADTKAQNDVNINGQLYANKMGTCFLYRNDEKKQTFNKNNCPSGQIGSQITYTVAQGTYTSTISLNDANNKALNDISNNGQAYANANGTCLQSTFRNVAVSRTFIKNCGFGYQGSTVTYVVQEGKHTSTVSQQDADQKAQDDISMNGQLYANNNGTCQSMPTVVSSVYNYTSAPNLRIQFTSSKGSVTYSIPSGFSSFSVPQDTYSITINQDNYSGNYSFSLNNNSIRGSYASWQNFAISGSLNISIGN